jgi:hypothetical protein
VTTAIALIAEASFVACSPILTWILLSLWAAVLKACSVSHKLRHIQYYKLTRVISFWIRALFA